VLALVGAAVVVWAVFAYSQLQSSTGTAPDLPPAPIVSAPPSADAPPPQQEAAPAGAPTISADPAWTQRVSQLTGIPARALHA
ncbi:hypothetical protein, partial [Escherichia coli]|uniref:hypothetical protein n=1 Tax=Escherichia coli TaxID=562 RepID=UPI001EDBBC86